MFIILTVACICLRYIGFNVSFLFFRKLTQKHTQIYEKIKNSKKKERVGVWFARGAYESNPGLTLKHKQIKSSFDNLQNTTHKLTHTHTQNKKKTMITMTWVCFFFFNVFKTQLFDSINFCFNFVVWCVFFRVCMWVIIFFFFETSLKSLYLLFWILFHFCMSLF